jgi:hypothetical protein
MTAGSRLPDFRARTLEAHARLGAAGAAALLEAGRAWDLSPALRAGGAVVFPHATYEVCGHHVAAAVHACLDSGADRVLALGVLHPRTDELFEARERVAAGGDPAAEPCAGIQGPGASGGRDDWRAEFSLLHFEHLMREETRRRGVKGPEVLLRFPYLAGGRPQRLRGIAELESLAKGAAIVATADPMHHGVGYGDPPGRAVAPDAAGVAFAREKIEQGFDLAGRGRFEEFQRHCIATRSDARDVGQVLGHLLGRFEARLLDLLGDDMTQPYAAPPPTWVACALIEIRPHGPPPRARPAV